MFTEALSLLKIRETKDENIRSGWNDEETINKIDLYLHLHLVVWQTHQFEITYKIRRKRKCFSFVTRKCQKGKIRGVFFVVFLCIGSCRQVLSSKILWILGVWLLSKQSCRPTIEAALFFICKVSHPGPQRLLKDYACPTHSLLPGSFVFSQLQADLSFPTPSSSSSLWVTEHTWSRVISGRPVRDS